MKIYKLWKPPRVANWSGRMTTGRVVKGVYIREHNLYWIRLKTGHLNPHQIWVNPIRPDPTGIVRIAEEEEGERRKKKGGKKLGVEKVGLH